MRICEQAYNAFWILLGSASCIISVQLTLWDETGPGNGFIPFVTGLLIGVSGVTLFLVELCKQFSPGASQPFLPNRPATVRILLVLGGLCFIAVTLSHLGFLISAFLVLCCLLRAIEPQRWWVVLVIAVISCVAAYGLFSVLLQVPLPKGLLGF